MVDYESSFKRPFLDLKNLVIGIVLSILPIINWFAIGYTLECTGLTKRKYPLNKSPEWADWGNLFVKGFLTTVIAIVYMLPAIIILFITLFSALVALFAQITPSIATSSSFSEVIMQNWDKIVPIITTVLPAIAIVILLILLASYLIPVAVMNYLANDRLGKAFDVSNVLKKAFRGAYFGAWLITLLASIVAGFILGWIPLIGGAAGSFIVGVISYSILGQVYKEISKNGAVKKK